MTLNPIRLISTLKERLTHLIRWLPIIWQDRDWDHYYLAEIIKFKLLNMARYSETEGHLVSSKKQARQLKIAAIYLDRLQNKEHLNEGLLSKCMDIFDKYKIVETTREGWTCWSYPDEGTSPEFDFYTKLFINTMEAERKQAKFYLEGFCNEFKRHYTGWWD